MIGGSPLTVFQDAASTWRWDATTGAWSQPEGNEAEGAGAWEEVSATETELVAVRSCTTNPAVTVFPHRWNMVGNPCDRPVDLPGDARALLWNGSGYTVSQSIPVGMAAWVLPGSPSLVLTPGWGTFPDQPIPHVPGPKEGDAYARTNRPFPQGAGADQSARYRLHCSFQLLTLATSLDMLL
jgi:hypothetical protein